MCRASVYFPEFPYPSPGAAVRRVVRIVLFVLVALIVVGLGLYAWASAAASRKLSRGYTVHTVDFPIPFPLPEDEVRRLGLTPESARLLARDRALERARHLVESRYACRECHGRDFGGGVMIDDPAIGRLLGPNLTSGRGSRTAGFRAADWDRSVRHGVLRDGRPSLMPSVDFEGMSDQELSDIAVLVQSQPPVDQDVPRVALGPVGKALVATGKFVLSADLIAAHGDAPHDVTPPEAVATAEFGEHLAGTCKGCHGQNLAGGPIVGGDPSWPPAANLTPDPTGLASWTSAQFARALREGKRPDGTALRSPMSGVVPYATKLSDVEVEALWMYLRSLPAVARRK
jgi:mono/diheme cytochrome c family protein